MNLTLSDNDLANLILQRTGPFLQLGGGSVLNQWFATGDKRPLVAYLKGIGKVNEFVNALFAGIAADFNPLSPHIRGASAGTVVSIGPGYGFLELLIYGINQPRLLLIDIERSPEHEHGFAQQGSGYADLTTWKKFLTSNGVDAKHIETCNPRKQPLPQGRFDVLVSLLSMGFHYPCTEYAAFILAGLRPGGLLILDKRAKVSDPGWDTLQPHFEVVSQDDTPKWTRFVLKRT